MLRAAKLDVDLYEEVEADTTANWQALYVVIIVSLAAGIGRGIYGLLWANEDITSFLWGLLIAPGYIIAGWLILALVIYLIGTTIFKTKETETDYDQLLRTIGFALTPGILIFFLFVPYLGFLLYPIAFIWMIVAGVIAVKQALDFSTWRAIGTGVVGFIPYLMLLGLLNWLIL